MNREKKYEMLKSLSCLPKKILALHGADNTTEFVLHELCSSNCFNLSKAAYFVDNPDFNCCKGIAGCDRKERFENDSWCAPDDFSCHMKQSIFNQKVREAHFLSLGASSLESQVSELAQKLDMKNPGFHRWKLKNGNHGILIFEKPQNENDGLKEYLEDGLSLLGFCPIF